MKTTGEIAYQAYCKYSKGKSLVSGDTLPTWKYLSPEIRTAWNLAGDAVAEAMGIEDQKEIKRLNTLLADTLEAHKQIMEASNARPE